MKGKFITTQIMIVCMGNKTKQTESSQHHSNQANELIATKLTGSGKVITGILLSETIQAA